MSLPWQRNEMSMRLREEEARRVEEERGQRQQTQQQHAAPSTTTEAARHVVEHVAEQVAAHTVSRVGMEGVYTSALRPADVVRATATTTASHQPQQEQHVSTRVVKQGLEHVEREVSREVHEAISTTAQATTTTTASSTTTASPSPVGSVRRIGVEGVYTSALRPIGVVRTTPPTSSQQTQQPQPQPKQQVTAPIGVSGATQRIGMEGVVGSSPKTVRQAAQQQQPKTQAPATTAVTAAPSPPTTTGSIGTQPKTTVSSTAITSVGLGRRVGMEGVVGASAKTVVETLASQPPQPQTQPTKTQGITPTPTVGAGAGMRIGMEGAIGVTPSAVREAVEQHIEQLEEQVKSEVTTPTTTPTTGGAAITGPGFTVTPQQRAWMFRSRAVEAMVQQPTSAPQGITTATGLNIPLATPSPVTTTGAITTTPPQYGPSQGTLARFLRNIGQLNPQALPTLTNVGGAGGSNVGGNKSSGGSSSELVQQTIINLANEIVETMKKNPYAMPGVKGAELAAYLDQVRQSDPQLYQQLMSNPVVQQALRYYQQEVQVSEAAGVAPPSISKEQAAAQFATDVVNTGITELNNALQSGDYAKAQKYISELLDYLKGLQNTPGVNTQEVNALIQQLQSLNEQIQTIQQTNQLLQQYNQLVQQYNQLVQQANAPLSPEATRLLRVLGELNPSGLSAYQTQAQLGRYLQLAPLQVEVLSKMENLLTQLQAINPQAFQQIGGETLLNQLRSQISQIQSQVSQIRSYLAAQPAVYQFTNATQQVAFLTNQLNQLIQKYNDAVKSGDIKAAEQYRQEILQLLPQVESAVGNAITLTQQLNQQYPGWSNYVQFGQGDLSTYLSSLQDLQKRLQKLENNLKQQGVQEEYELSPIGKIGEEVAESMQKWAESQKGPWKTLAEVGVALGEGAMGFVLGDVGPILQLLSMGVAPLAGTIVGAVEGSKAGKEAEKLVSEALNAPMEFYQGLNVGEEKGGFTAGNVNTPILSNIYKFITGTTQLTPTAIGSLAGFAALTGLGAAEAATRGLSAAARSGRLAEALGSVAESLETKAPRLAETIRGIAANLPEVSEELSGVAERISGLTSTLLKALPSTYILSPFGTAATRFGAKLIELGEEMKPLEVTGFRSGVMYRLGQLVKGVGAGIALTGAALAPITARAEYTPGVLARVEEVTGGDMAKAIRESSTDLINELGIPREKVEELAKAFEGTGGTLSREDAINTFTKVLGNKYLANDAFDIVFNTLKATSPSKFFKEEIETIEKLGVQVIPNPEEVLKESVGITGKDLADVIKPRINELINPDLGITREKLNTLVSRLGSMKGVVTSEEARKIFTEVLGKEAGESLFDYVRGLLPNRFFADEISEVVKKGLLPVAVERTRLRLTSPITNIRDVAAILNPRYYAESMPFPLKALQGVLSLNELAKAYERAITRGAIEGLSGDLADVIREAAGNRMLGFINDRLVKLRLAVNDAFAAALNSVRGAKSLNDVADAITDALAKSAAKYDVMTGDFGKAVLAAVNEAIISDNDLARFMKAIDMLNAAENLLREGKVEDVVNILEEVSTTYGYDIARFMRDNKFQDAIQYLRGKIISDRLLPRLRSDVIGAIARRYAEADYQFLAPRILKILTTPRVVGKEVFTGAESLALYTPELNLGLIRRPYVMPILRGGELEAITTPLTMPRNIEDLRALLASISETSELPMGTIYRIESKLITPYAKSELANIVIRNPRAEDILMKAIGVGEVEALKSAMDKIIDVTRFARLRNMYKSLIEALATASERGRPELGAELLSSLLLGTRKSAEEVYRLADELGISREDVNALMTALRKQIGLGVTSTGEAFGETQLAETLAALGGNVREKFLEDLVNAFEKSIREDSATLKDSLNDVLKRYGLPEITSKDADRIYDRFVRTILNELKKMGYDVVIPEGNVLITSIKNLPKQDQDAVMVVLQSIINPPHLFGNTEYFIQLPEETVHVTPGRFIITREGGEVFEIAEAPTNDIRTLLRATEDKNRVRVPVLFAAGGETPLLTVGEEFPSNVSRMAENILKEFMEAAPTVKAGEEEAAEEAGEAAGRLGKAGEKIGGEIKKVETGKEGTTGAKGLKNLGAGGVGGEVGGRAGGAGGAVLAEASEEARGITRELRSGLESIERILGRRYGVPGWFLNVYNAIREGLETLRHGRTIKIPVITEEVKPVTAPALAQPVQQQQLQQQVQQPTTIQGIQQPVQQPGQAPQPIQTQQIQQQQQQVGQQQQPTTQQRQSGLPITGIGQQPTTQQGQAPTQGVGQPPITAPTTGQQPTTSTPTGLGSGVKSTQRVKVELPTLNIKLPRYPTIAKKAEEWIKEWLKNVEPYKVGPGTGKIALGEGIELVTERTIGEQHIPAEWIEELGMTRYGAPYLRAWYPTSELPIKTEYFFESESPINQPGQPQAYQPYTITETGLGQEQNIQWQPQGIAPIPLVATLYGVGTINPPTTYQGTVNPPTTTTITPTITTTTTTQTLQEVPPLEEYLENPPWLLFPIFFAWGPTGFLQERWGTAKSARGGRGRERLVLI